MDESRIKGIWIESVAMKSDMFRKGSSEICVADLSVRYNDNSRGSLCLTIEVNNGEDVDKDVDTSTLTPEQKLYGRQDDAYSYVITDDCCCRFGRGLYSLPEGASDTVTEFTSMEEAFASPFGKVLRSLTIMFRLYLGYKIQ